MQRGLGERWNRIFRAWRLAAVQIWESGKPIWKPSWLRQLGFCGRRKLSGRLSQAVENGCTCIHPNTHGHSHSSPDRWPPKRISSILDLHCHGHLFNMIEKTPGVQREDQTDSSDNLA